MHAPAPANFAYRRLDTLVVAVHNAQPPSDPEWRGYLTLCHAVAHDVGIDIRKASAVIFTDGGVPTSAQRNQLARQLAGRTPNSAVVSESLRVRVPLAVLSMINPGVKVFSAREWRKALDFANVPAEKQLEVLKVAVALGREVGDPQVLRAIGL
jgi:hypothetical protein